jgi:hypothetical protein
MKAEKSPQAHIIFLAAGVGNLGAMSTLTENGMNDRRRAADPIDRSGRARLREIKCHTMQSNLASKLLKTNDSYPRKVSHFFEGPRRVKDVFHQSPITTHKSLRGSNG